MIIKKVLLVEDNPALLEMYKIAFSESSFEMQAATNGVEGLTKAVDFKPDVILLDIMMPHMDGYEFISAIKGNSEMHSQIVVNSNLEQQRDVRKALDQGADSYIKKSEYTAFEIVDIINHWNETGEWDMERFKSF